MYYSFLRCVYWFGGCFSLASVSIAAIPGTAKQFQLTTEATATSDIGRFYRGPANLKDFPIRALWIQKDRSSCTEQDARMKQRVNEVVEFGAMVAETKGLLLRLREHFEPGEAAEETFIPLPEEPAASPSNSTRHASFTTRCTTN